MCGPMLLGFCNGWARVYDGFAVVGHIFATVLQWLGLLRDGCTMVGYHSLQLELQLCGLELKLCGLALEFCDLGL